MVQETLVESKPPTGTYRCAGIPDTNFADFISYSKKRVLEGEGTPVPEKILSVGGDEDAAYITKNGRDAVIGYPPQVARSGKGFIGLFYPPGKNAYNFPFLCQCCGSVKTSREYSPEKQMSMMA